MTGGGRTRGAALLVAVGVVLLVGAFAPAGLAQESGDDARSIDALADEVVDQYEETNTAVSMASSPVAPALLGGGLGLGIGAIGGAVFAYQNRGMR
ncbi:hypothetical protein [Halobaculum gomorrense]|uniref:Uncharacterized protein n=1 Tax=Halobaculum gomorrense TaxID=43928 RepID=A0A1M5NUT0_9EURY|nr:hypothetical protein [Halobaculum gomorrense]SHG92939.1 hypothetical protein SAMN05443636_1344 [Halobaculum gomorrense]